MVRRRDKYLHGNRPNYEHAETHTHESNGENRLQVYF
jgi:hypothetical protein